MRLSRRAVIGCALAGCMGGLAGPWLAHGSSVPQVHMEVHDGRRLWTANAVPNHAVGDYSPHRVQAQTLQFAMPAEPQVAPSPTPVGHWFFGIAVNGVPFDPGGPLWSAQWWFEVMHPGNATALGIDANHAHTQRGGLYHYHGLPTGLLWELRSRLQSSDPLVLGYAADGFPIVAPDLPQRRLRSGYRLRRGHRPCPPGGRFDGTFVQDFEFTGAGDLDECNGRIGPDGVYHYVLTDEFPFIPRLYRGTPDPSFRHGPPPGVSPPLPPELRAWRPPL